MTAHVVPIVLRRRSSQERRALALLRGGEQALQRREARPAPEMARQTVKSQSLFFAELRRMAGCHGLSVRPAGDPFVGADELTLLGWIAQEQRISSQGRAIPADPLLLAAIARCAGLLEALGVHLSPHTLYGARLRGSGSHDQPGQTTGRISGASATVRATG